MRWLWLLAGLVGLVTWQARPARADDLGPNQPVWSPPEPAAQASANYGMPAIPLDSLDPDLRDKVRSVLARPTLSARSRPETFNTDHAFYRYLLDHPDHAVKLWRRLGAQVSDINDQGGGRYVWQDGQGSMVHWQIGLRAPGLHLWYAEGKVRPGLFLPAQTFRALALLHYTEGVDTKGLPAVRHQVHFVLRCDNRAVALVTRLMGHSAPRLAEQYLGQLQAFYGGMAWYVYQDDERARQLFQQVGLTMPELPAR
jgi:hypothetical protein